MQASEEVLNKLTSISDVQTKGLKRLKDEGDQYMKQVAEKEEGDPAVSSIAGNYHYVLPIIYFFPSLPNYRHLLFFF